MKHSDLKRILDKYESANAGRAAVSNLLSWFRFPSDLAALRQFYHSCIEAGVLSNHSLQDLSLFPGQLFQLYGQILMKSGGKVSYFRNAILQIETVEDKDMRERIERIQQLGCLPAADIQSFDYVLLGRLIKYLPLNLLKVEILQSIFDACNTAKIQLADECYLEHFPRTLLMTETNFKILGAYMGYSTSLGYALDKLPPKMLNQYYFNLLTKADVLEENTFIDDSESTKPEKLCFVISRLRPQFLNYETFNTIVKHINILYGANLHKLVPDQFTQEVFNHILSLCEKEYPSIYTNQVLIRNYIQKIRGELDHPCINNHESTETESIHATVSESAIKMWKEYGSQIDTEETLNNQIQAIQAFLIAEKNRELLSHQNPMQPESEYLYQITKASECFTRIFAREDSAEAADIPYAEHADERNNINLKQMLALQFIAIHDAKLRIGSLEDALKKFVIALYDMQRGKNQDGFNQDNRTDFDLPICRNGHLNKAAEITWGIHPLTQLVYIDHKLASAKFPIIVKEEVQNYLLTVKKLESRSTLNQQLIGMQSRGIEAVWSKVEKPVTARLLAEFSLLFPKTSDLQKFTAASYPSVDVRDGMEEYQRSGLAI